MKIKLSILILFFILSATPIQIFASSLADSFPAHIHTYTNHTQYRYKIENGKTYKRLWSITYSRWEDPYWTLV